MATVSSPLTGSFTATGASNAVVLYRGPVNVLIAGGTGTVSVQRSFDGGTTWHILDYDRVGTPATYSTSAGSVGINGVFEVAETQELWRLNCSAYTAEITYRVAQ